MRNKNSPFCLFFWLFFYFLFLTAFQNLHTVQPHFNNGPWSHSVKGAPRGQMIKKLQFAKLHWHQVLIHCVKSWGLSNMRWRTILISFFVLLKLSLHSKIYFPIASYACLRVHCQDPLFAVRNYPGSIFPTVQFHGAAVGGIDSLWFTGQKFGGFFQPKFPHC